MRWILCPGDGIEISDSQLQARQKFIHRITGADVSAWNYIPLAELSSKGFIYCKSNDTVNGTFVTAHIGDIMTICELREVCESEIIIANTCIWERMAHKKLLYRIMSINENISLFFARQELSIDANRTFRKSTTLHHYGQFNFQTTLSERALFINRNKGFIKAINESFERVSPVLLMGD